MFGFKLLPHKIVIKKYSIRKNSYGEEERMLDDEVIAKAFVNSRKSRIVNEKYGIIEDIFYEILTQNNMSISKEDEIEFSGLVFKIREILPVYDIHGKMMFQKLLVERKE